MPNLTFSERRGKKFTKKLNMQIWNLSCMTNISIDLKSVKNLQKSLNIENENLTENSE